MIEELLYDERMQYAKVLYTQKDNTPKEVAAKVNVDEATVRQWANEGQWDGVKRSLLISKNTQLEHFYNILEKLNEKACDVDKLDPKVIDLIVKYTTSIKNLEADTSVCSIIEVAEQFTNWLLRKDLEFTKKVTMLFDAFIKQKLAT